MCFLFFLKNISVFVSGVLGMYANMGPHKEEKQTGVGVSMLHEALCYYVDT